MHSSEILSFENGEVSRLIESSGENSLFNERSKTLLPDANWRQVKEFTPFSALEITQIH